MKCFKVNYDVVCEIHEFLKNYANIYGLLLLKWYFNKIFMAVVFFSTNYSYASIYHNYIQAYKYKYSKEIPIMTESTFTNIWKILILSFQFISLKSNLCCYDSSLLVLQSKLLT